jgi:hypothetical protein
MTLVAVTLDDLTIEDEASFKHVGIYDDLKRIVRGAGRGFLVPARGTTLSWDRALFLNLAFWDASMSDVLVSHELPADVVAHIAWHHLTDEHVAPSAEAHLLAECIASAFDVYLIGRLIGHSPESTFLASQVPRMAEVASDAGLSDEGFEALLEEVSREPERAFEDLRALLYDVGTALTVEMPPVKAAEVLEKFDAHRFGPLLHHYEVATWILRARIEHARAPSAVAEQIPPARGPMPKRPTAAEVDSSLRACGPKDPALDWLARTWVEPSLDMR